MRLSVFNLATAHEHGSVFYDYLALRKRFFVDELEWDIPHDELVEMDQYDTPQAHYSVVSHRGQVIGGARVLPTKARWGGATYMLGDARKGLIDGIPAKIVPDDIEGPDVWECTRLAFDSDLAPAQRLACLDLVVDGAVTAARERGATRMVALSQVGLVRAVRKLGYAPAQCGPAYRDAQNGRAYAVLTMEPWKTAELENRPVAA